MGSRVTPLGPRPQVQVELTARLQCTAEEAKRLVDRRRDVSFNGEEGEAIIRVSHRVENNTPPEAARKEVMILEQAAKIAGVDREAWRQLSVSAEPVFYVEGAWRRRGGAVA